MALVAIAFLACATPTPTAAAADAGLRPDEPLDVTMDQHFCFPPEVRQRPRGSRFALGMHADLRLEISNWPSHRLVTRMAEILLRERMGYGVRVLSLIHI